MGATDADSAGAAEPATLDVVEMLAAARDPDPDVQAARLREWACSDDAPLMLDMRSADDFAAARLDGAVNIPFEDLDGRLHELPPRSKPLAVVLARAPSPEEQARVFAADFKGLPWRVRAFFLPDPSLFDAHARAAGVDVRSGEVHPRDRGHLWEPSDMVARWLPRLEARMARAWNAEALLAGVSPPSPSPSPSPSPTGDLADETSRPLCVDVGCGAGRDAVWAAMRGWRVLALDSDARGLARCAALAETHGVSRRVFPIRVDLLKTSPEDALAMASRVAAGHAARLEDTNADANANAVNPPRAGSNPTSTATGTGRVRAVLAVRFLHRAFVRALPAALPASAAVCWFHFMRGAERTAVGRPNKSKDLLEVGELRVLFEEARWRVLRDDATTLPDGRPVSEFVAVNDAGDEPTRGDDDEPAGASDDAKHA